MERRCSRLLAALAVSTCVALVALPAPADAYEGSYISSSSNGANLRPCPRVPAYGATDCAGTEFAPDYTPVEMICWTEGVEPYDGASRKWFWVRQLDGAPSPGAEAYVWSDLVADQTWTPECASEPDDYVQQFQTSPVSLEQGSPAPYGYYYQVTLDPEGVGQDRYVEVTCTDADDRSGYYTYTVWVGTTDPVTTSVCYSGISGEHSVWVDGGMLVSNTVDW